MTRRKNKSKASVTPSSSSTWKKAPEKVEKKKEKQYPDFIDSSSTTAKVSYLKAKPIPEAPSVYYTKEAWETLWFLVQECNMEVGWLGLVDEVPEFNYYLITDIYVPEQEVTSVTTEIEPEAMTELVMQLMDEGKDPSKLRYWGHSHVDMGVSPSTTDELQVEEYLKDTDWFIRGIYNKKGSSKVDVYDLREELLFQCVYNELFIEAMSKERKAELKALIKANVSKAFPTQVLRQRYPYADDPYVQTRKNNDRGNGFNYVPDNAKKDLPIATVGSYDWDDEDAEDLEEYLAKMSDPFFVQG